MFRLKSFLQPAEKDPYSKKKPPDPQREFYLEENKHYQYTPTQKLNFAASKLLLYKSKGFTFKIFYLSKLLIPIIGVTTLVNSITFLDFTILVAGVAGSITTLGLGHSFLCGRICKEIYLHEDGNHLDFVFSLLGVFSRSVTLPIRDLRSQFMSPLMFMWSLHPIPKNILAGIECEFDHLTPLYTKHNSKFYILYGKPYISHQDLLVNALNGVEINTKAFKGRVVYFRERYNSVR